METNIFVYGVKFDSVEIRHERHGKTGAEFLNTVPLRLKKDSA
jgi:hypothetical protein